VRFADLPEGLLGYTDLSTGEIVLDRSLTQVERRCTLTHELEHVHRGHIPDDPVLLAREEELVEQLSARRLVTLRDLIDALLWSDRAHEVADELWVDLPTLKARIAGLAEDERAAIEERMAGSDRWTA
jgi:hypothetical protein